jgi:uncharacterized 2Fe-2S/4Fe-4S cluster protein (DUF4445 family)
MYSIAIDLGTTTLAVSLVDDSSGQRLAMNGSMNPQRRFGADVVSRLDAAVNSEENLRDMSFLVRDELLRLALELCSRSSVDWNHINRIAIAGNPAMQHILLQLPVKSLAFPPYRPLFTSGRTLQAAELGWPGNASVYIFPMPGGFVGGDTVAFLFGTEKPEFGTRDSGLVKAFDLPWSLVPGPGSRLYLDMGTNGEMALLDGETIWATSAAAGPAFEGGNLSCGMAALPGAISSVRVLDEKVKLAVIANATPVGICGSAAIETVTELLRCDLLEDGGRLRECGEVSTNLATRLIRHNDENAFVIYRDARHLLLLTQGDIRQIQLAKGAIRAGMEVLFQRSGIAAAGLQQVILTGSFGAVLRPEWLKTVGIFEENMVHISLFTPEGALSGVERALNTNDCFESVERLGNRFKVVPLSGTPVFEEKFLQHINFPAR